MIAHIVNPARVGPDSDLHAAQPLTFESMRRARERAALKGVRVSLYTAQLAADREPVEGFTATPDLTRTVLDLCRFAEPRPLPLIGDILARLYSASEAATFIYTNVDIAVHPDFYLAIAGERAQGRDAFSINRRTVSLVVSDLDALLADPGEPHAGHDCFVFARELLEQVDFRGVCIGFPPVGRVLLAALSTRARDFATLTDRFLTFHAQDRKQWQGERYQDYWRHNQREALAVIDALAESGPLSPLALELRQEIAAQERM